MNDTTEAFNKKQEKYLFKFAENLNTGIQYYQNTFNNVVDKFEETKSVILSDLEKSKKALQDLHIEIQKLAEKHAPKPVLEPVTT